MLIIAKASKELQDAFNDLVSSFPAQRGILATITNERLVPAGVISSSDIDFFEDLKALDSLVKDNEAAYIILRRYHNAPDGYVAVTYVPDTAHVRSKMLFAATRLTLVRELGTERFRETLFATTKQELTPDGWRRHDRHGESKAPLTDEEQALQGVKEAEAEASRGTTARNSHVSSGLSFPMSSDALDALRNLAHSTENLIQLVGKSDGAVELVAYDSDEIQRIDPPNEAVEIVNKNSVSAQELASAISDTEPRYSFFRYTHTFDGQEQAPVVFIYTCPSGSKIKERMLYASSRAGIISTAESEAALKITKKVSQKSHRVPSMNRLISAFSWRSRTHQR